MKSNTISQPKLPAGVPAQGRTNFLCRILLVDDDRELLSYNAELLVESGYHVDTAEDGAAAWKALKDHHYDVLITDNIMPKVTGLELIKKLRSEDMTLAVILASGTTPKEELIQNPRLHINAVLPKPYSIADLVRTVDKILHKSGTGRRATAGRSQSDLTAAKNNSGSSRQEPRM
jgi:two-component system OmpR family response regulator